MGKTTGFMDYPKEVPGKQDIFERIKDYNEFDIPLPESRLKTQAARCMDCGVPFCNWGCPVQNLIPEFNDFVYHNQWKAAYGTLQSTNNFPEFTGRICPALCESACCCELVSGCVSIKSIEKTIIEKAFQEGWVVPNVIMKRSGKKIAVIGSGPAGLAAAQQLNLAGHSVTVFEKNEVVGGLLALGIPDFKLEKHIIDRRIDILKKEGIKFQTNAWVGKNIAVKDLLKEFDYICLSCGSEKPRDLPITGREKDGIYFAMDFLAAQNRRVGGRVVDSVWDISAEDKDVVVIGGGDTGSDCVGTSIRQGARSVTQLEILPMPPKTRSENDPWPRYPNILRTSTSHEEGCRRYFSVTSEEFLGETSVTGVRCADVTWKEEAGQKKMLKIAGSEFTVKADLVLLAMGFVHPVHEGLVQEMKLELDPRGNVKTENHKTSHEKIFAAGDMITGQSLVVRAIYSGRSMAKALDQVIKGYSNLS